MAIKSDRWIRHMAEQGMIDPFEPAQVREGDAGKKAIFGQDSVDWKPVYAACQ